MHHEHNKLKSVAQLGRRWRERRGIIVVLTSFLLTVLFAFLALSVDTGRVVLTETRMQNAVDAAALAASQEITAAVYAAGQGQGSANIDANSIAVEAARNDGRRSRRGQRRVRRSGQQDVKFGKRVYNPSTGEWPVQWGGAPFNVVKVTARRTGDDTTAPDGEFPLAFGWSIGKDSVPLQTSATAFTEARDLVLVLDVSASMNDDSSFNIDAARQPGHYACWTACGIRWSPPIRNGLERPRRNSPAPASAPSIRTTARTFPAPRRPRSAARSA